MGTMGNKIIELDIDKLIEMLNKALADEWLAYYQYWIGAKVVKGCMRAEVVEELEEHAKEELEHADMLVERILQLGGTPILDPKQWYEQTICGFTVPNQFDTKSILKQNIQGEVCAIGVYKNILEFVKDKDMITYELVLKILTDEVEHEDDLENILEDLKVCKEG